MTIIMEPGIAKVDELRTYERNARRGNLDIIKESLLRNGQYRTIVVNKRTGEVLAGNHTFIAAKELGWSEIAVDWVDVDDAAAKRIVLVDNRSNDIAGYDEEALAELLQELEGDYDGTGYDKDAFDDLMASLEPGFGGKKDEDAIPPEPDVPITQIGDFIRLGDHVLICADAQQFDDWGQYVDEINLTVTSPPYNLGLDKYKPSGMQKENPAWVNRMGSAYNDSLPEDVYQGQQIRLLDRIMDLTSDDGSLFYNHQIRYREKSLISPLEWLWNTGWKVRQEIIWDRGGGTTLNAGMFLPVDQRIYWLQKGMKNVFNDTAEIKAYSTIWPIAPKAEIKVSAPFPVEMPRRIITACSHKDDTIFDPFGGTGTTLIAAHQLDRKAIIVELNPAYCDVIVDRFERFTGIKAERG